MKKFYKEDILSVLTTREKEITYLLINGERSKTIADNLKLKVNTVSTFKKNIYTKLKVNSPIALYKLINDLN